jgi:hypothetical protein
MPDLDENDHESTEELFYHSSKSEERLSMTQFCLALQYCIVMV